MPPAEKITFGNDGSISVTALGAGSKGQSTIDRLKLITHDASQLEKGQDGLFRGLEVAGEYEVSPDVRISSGALEDSNVNIINELTQVIALARDFEMQIKTMKSIEESDQQSARLLQLN